eukprot:COSAG01_NODE_3378_length_6172_cov_8.333114_3_plen_274_part_00
MAGAAADTQTFDSTERRRRVQVSQNAADASLLSRTTARAGPISTRRGGRRGTTNRNAASRRNSTGSSAAPPQAALTRTLTAPARAQNPNAAMPLMPPPASLQWLHHLDIPYANRSPSLKSFPPRTSDKVGKCYSLCNNMQQSEDLAIASLGRKLHCILPTLVFGPVGAHGEYASQIIRRRCTLFCRGQWQQLWEERPRALTEQQRRQWTDAVDNQRGFVIDESTEGAIKSVEEGRLTQAVRRMTSAGIVECVERAWRFFQTIFFAPPAVAPML